MDKGIELNFFIGGEPYATRRWIAVPRVGDTVKLKRGESYDPARITEVVWGIESERERDLGMLAVNLRCEWIEEGPDNG